MATPRTFKLDSYEFRFWPDGRMEERLGDDRRFKRYEAFHSWDPDINRRTVMTDRVGTQADVLRRMKQYTLQQIGQIDRWAHRLRCDLDNINGMLDLDGSDGLMHEYIPEGAIAYRFHHESGTLEEVGDG